MPRRSYRKSSKKKSRDNGIKLKKSKQKCRFNFGLEDKYENVLYNEHLYQCCDEKDFQYIKPKHENEGMCYGEKGAANRKSDFAKVKKNVLSRYKDNPKNKFSIQNDPTKNDYYDWIAKNYNKLVNNNNLEDELYLLNQVRVKTSSELDDIYNTKLPLENQKMKDFELKFTNLDSLVKNIETEISQGNQVQDYVTLYDGVYGELTVPVTKNASCSLGKGTKWCTAAESGLNMFENYNNQGRLFIWKDKRIHGDNKFQFQFESFSFMNSKDKPIKSDIFYYLLEVPVLNELFAIMLAKKNIVVKFAIKFLNIYSKDIFDEYFEDYLSGVYTNEDEMMLYKIYIIRKQDKEIERKLLTEKNNGLLVHYAIYSLGKRWNLIEPLLLKKELNFAVDYTEKLIRDRWVELEELLLNDNDISSAIKYAEKVIRDRWIELEELLLNNVNLSSAVKYAEKIIRDRWIELEQRLLENDINLSSAINYAEKIIKKRWVELEELLLNDNDISSAVKYAEKVIKKRWVELEELLLKSGDDYYMKNYMEKCIKNRWPEYEQILLKSGDNYILERYMEKYIKGRWPEYEKKLVESGDGREMKYYMEKYIKGRWPEYEKLLLEIGTNYGLQDYMETYIKGKWPEYEKRLLKNDKSEDKYYLDKYYEYINN